MPFVRSYLSLLLIAIIICDFSYSQVIPDSLLHKLNTAPNDSVKARTLLDIGETIEATSTEKCLTYYQQALAISKKINNNHLLLSSWNNVGIAYLELNKMDSAILSFEQAIPVARSLNDTLRVAKVLMNIGNVCLHKKDPATAIEYYLQAARLWETCADQNMLPSMYSNICSLLTDQKEYDKALEYGNKAYSLAMKVGDDYSAVNALLNLSATYRDLRQFDHELELLQKAFPLVKKGKDIEQIATFYEDMGNYYYQRKQYPSSLTNYLESYKYSQQMANPIYLCGICYRLSVTYHGSGEPGKALQYIVKAEKLASEVGARADLEEIYEARARIEERAGHYKLASEYFSKTLTLSDSLFKASTSQKVAEVEAQYQTEKKQGEIVQLEKDKQIQSLSLRQKSSLNYFLIGSLAALLLIGFLGYRNFSNRHLLVKKEFELQQRQISELAKDRQLIAVDSMLKGQEDERSRLAKDLHDGLGGLLSGVKFSLSNMKDNLVITPDNMAVFERSLDMLDTSIKELRRVAHNMMPEILTQFGLDEAVKEYCNTINTTKLLTVRYQALGMDARLDNSVEIVIYRIIQELLNNTMKHAAATEVFVQLIREGARLSIVVEDNGKGFDPSLAENNKGAGLTNIRSRVDYLKGQLDIHAEPGRGTLINIEFNV
jgi:two-component system NarL family sensor kinase